jgi:CheY-like chemotaxis protein
MKPKKKVFCVEDNKQVASLIQKNLESLGFQPCGTADSAATAITAITNTRPDMVLIDIELYGKLEGLAIGEYLSEKTDIPFIYLSGHDDQKILDSARRTIPDGFLLKPFDSRQLRVALDMARRVD